jgi:uncharacterized protein (DUF111 family)
VTVISKYSDEILVLETNIDDSSGEMLGFVLERLFKEGAKDAFFTSIYMKKNRPAYKLTVLCDKSKKEAMENIIFDETTAIGIRYRLEKRTCLDRCLDEFDTCYGKIKVKCVETNKGLKVYPEYESARQAAEKFSVPLSYVYQAVKNYK